jgi:hypothetical protein
MESMCEDDRVEAFILTGRSALQVISYAVEHFPITYVIRHGDDWLGIGGMSSVKQDPGLDGLIGVPWFLSCEGIHDHRLAFLKYSRRIIEWCDQYYSQMYNCVPVGSRRSIDWLESLDFHMEEEHLIEPYMVPVLPFWRVNVCVSS